MSQQRPQRRRRRRPRRPVGSSGESEVGARPENAESSDSGGEARGPGGGRRRGGDQAQAQQPQRRTIFGLPRMSVALLGGLLIAMIAVFAMQLIFPPEEVTQVEGVTVYPDQGRRHLDEGETFDDYNSFPPTSGPQPAEGAEVKVWLSDDENIPTPVEMLPLLERGGIVIYYDPDVYEDAEDPTGLLGALRSLRQFRERLAAVPIEGLAQNRSDGATILAVAWRTMLPVQSWNVEGDTQLSGFMQNAPEGYYDRYRLERDATTVSAASTDEQ